ncbi:hypothetical protein [Tabrizicola sp.]|uniref:hypothetical protein n=1 Tax=Tabrizicola sp. TaxID=2005166 RepID=UPI0035B26208
MANDFEDTIRLAAKRVQAAVDAVLQQYRGGYVADEDDITPLLAGEISGTLRGQIGGLTWNSAVVRHRKGTAAEEQRVGADLVIHVKFKTKDREYSKGVLVQAKKIEPGIAMTERGHKELVDQCQKMLAITNSSYVFDYQRRAISCGSATRIAGSSRRVLSDDCTMTSYRFFLELFRCPIGDRRLTSALVRDLPIPLLEIAAED